MLEQAVSKYGSGVKVGGSSQLSAGAVLLRRLRWRGADERSEEGDCEHNREETHVETYTGDETVRPKVI